MQRVLICTLNSKYIHTNLAIRLLYQLNRNRPGLTWKEFTLKQHREEVARECARFDIVAFSCYIWNITATLQVCRLIRTLNPSTRILLGGPEVSYDYDSIISNDDVDFIIPGEGETAFGAFLEQSDAPSKVPGLVWKENGRVFTNAPAAAFDVRELAGVMPYADDPPESLKNKVLYIETSRGCPYKCGFCLASLDNKVRYLPQQHIETTLLYLMAHGTTIKFLDRTFNIKKDFTLGIFEFILRHHKPGHVFQFEITADILHPAIISFIRDRVPPGLFRFEIGIQTVNREANLAVSRKQDFAKTRDVILQVKNKVELHLDLIVGLPLDRWPDVRRSFDDVFALHPPELQLGFLKFLKGTPVRDHHQQHGYVFDTTPPYQIVRSNYLSENELAAIEDLEDALELYWNGRKAVRTLTYLSARCSMFDFLVELGRRLATHGGSGCISLEQAYRLLHTIVSEWMPDDAVARELSAVDYFMHYKLRPALWFGATAGLSQNEKRSALLPLSFDLARYTEAGELSHRPTVARFVYDGRHTAAVEFETIFNEKTAASS